jgi:anti-anti-sigma regulatory factor
VDFMDAIGIRLLLDAAARADSDGVDFELIPSAAVDRMLDIADLRERFGCAAPPTWLAP